MSPKLVIVFLIIFYPLFIKKVTTKQKIDSSNFMKNNK